MIDLGLLILCLISPSRSFASTGSSLYRLVVWISSEGGDCDVFFVYGYFIQRLFVIREVGVLLLCQWGTLFPALQLWVLAVLCSETHF